MPFPFLRRPTPESFRAVRCRLTTALLPHGLLVQQAPRSRQRRSWIQSRVQEEKIARGKALDSRVPVVSRPTAARTHHMAETVRDRVACSSTQSVRELVPRYPVSTRDPPVPHVLACALEGVPRGGDGPGGRTMPSRDGSRDADGSVGEESGGGPSVGGDLEPQVTESRSSVLRDLGVCEQRMAWCFGVYSDVPGRSKPTAVAVYPDGALCSFESRRLLLGTLVW